LFCHAKSAINRFPVNRRILKYLFVGGAVRACDMALRRDRTVHRESAF
jgi:hypothetical protein